MKQFFYLEDIQSISKIQNKFELWHLNVNKK